MQPSHHVGEFVRRIILSASVVLLTAACGSSADHAGPVQTHASARASAKTSRPSATPTKSNQGSVRVTPSKAKSCGPERDVVIWYKTPGLPDSAQVVGNYDGACVTTFHSVETTSPTGAGYCTEAAWASDNPGYNADTTPAVRPRKAQVAVGPAC
ncbi:hypothetical protein AB0E08_10925 [Streptomyces sp. NPDC048281]|uniref:hypothetical protein n=1 Tax=Streptomyces sp. NPDC048281 TaxID=3154715 RepID=UPI00344041C1